MQKELISTIFIMLVIFASGSGGSDLADEPNATNELKRSAGVDNENDSAAKDADSPEETLRRFMLAMLSADKATIESLALQHEDLNALWQVPAPPPAILKQAEAQIRDIQFERLTAGEQFKLPSGQTMEITSEMLGDDQVFLTFESNPLPFELRRLDGEWKVNAEVLISTRKAAQEFSNQNRQK